MPKRKPICKNIKEIEEAMKKTADKTEYRKLQCIYLGDKNPEMSAAEIGKITQYSENSVKRIHCEYRKTGMKSIEEKRGGRYRAYLKLEEEEELLSGFDEISKAGELCEARRIKKAYEALIGKEVAESTIYRMLKRHGYRKVVPYQRHKKGDVEEQENFKKTSKV
jgi:transposase